MTKEEAKQNIAGLIAKYKSLSLAEIKGYSEARLFIVFANLY